MRENKTGILLCQFATEISHNFMQQFISFLHDEKKYKKTEAKNAPTSCSRSLYRTVSCTQQSVSSIFRAS